jgi:hypothetical protein
MLGLQGKSRRVLGFVPFGGRDRLVFVFHDRSKYCHNGGMTSAPSSRTDATAGSWGP